MGLSGRVYRALEVVVEMLRPVRERYLELRNDETELRRVLDGGAATARVTASGTLALMKERMGYR